MLSASADAKGRPLEVIKLPLPPVLHFTEAEARGVKARPWPARPEGGTASRLLCLQRRGAVLQACRTGLMGSSRLC